MDFIGDLFSFDKMVAPSIIKPLYWILMILIVLWSALTFIDGFFWFATDVTFWQGIRYMVFAVINVAIMVPLLRIGAESALALFEVREKLKGGDSQQVS
jgi:hypothetical protein